MQAVTWPFILCVSKLDIITFKLQSSLLHTQELLNSRLKLVLVWGEHFHTQETMVVHRPPPELCMKLNVHYQIYSYLLATCGYYYECSHRILFDCTYTLQVSNTIDFTLTLVRAVPTLMYHSLLRFSIFPCRIHPILHLLMEEETKCTAAIAFKNVSLQ